MIGHADLRERSSPSARRRRRQAAAVAAAIPTLPLIGEGDGAAERRVRPPRNDVGARGVSALVLARRDATRYGAASRSVATRHDVATRLPVAVGDRALFSSRRPENVAIFARSSDATPRAISSYQRRAVILGARVTDGRRSG